MQVKLFTIPVFGSEQLEEEMNRFLRSHRILQLERHFCSDDGGYWALLVEYVAGDPLAESPPSARRERKDYSEGLNDEEKGRFENYKAVRRELAQQLAIPAYLVFTNEELAILSRLPEISDDSIRGVKGIAPQRLKDYIKYFYGKTGGKSDAGDSVSGEPT